MYLYTKLSIIVIFLNSHPDVKPEHLERVSYVMSGAAPLAASDEKMFLEKAQKPIFIYQGNKRK